VEDFIMEYVGELIQDEEAEARDLWNDVEKVTYMFTLNDQVSINSIMNSY
jgi:hypothetical protein